MPSSSLFSCLSAGIVSSAPFQTLLIPSLTPAAAAGTRFECQRYNLIWPFLILHLLLSLPPLGTSWHSQVCSPEEMGSQCLAGHPWPTEVQISGYVRPLLVPQGTVQRCISWGSSEGCVTLSTCHPQPWPTHTCTGLPSLLLSFTPLPSPAPQNHISTCTTGVSCMQAFVSGSGLVWTQVPLGWTSFF